MIIAELNRVQEEHGWVSLDEARAVAAKLGVPLHRVEGVLSFYPHYRRTPPPAITIQVCRDASCRLRGGDALCRAAAGLAHSSPGCAIEEVSCIGLCDAAPAAAVNHVPVGGASLERLSRIAAGVDAPPAPEPLPTPSAWRIAADLPEPPAFEAPAVIAALREAGLRGMGGAGFPTAQKWELVRNAAGSEPPGRDTYVVCNADESEPGTFKDRVIMEELPWLVLEGLALASRVVGARKAIIYIRHEYERARRALEAALEQASGLPCPVEIFVSPGGYIMGEETALLEALEDRRGEPRNKPPFPGTHGLFGQPTVINNVETLAAAAVIWRRGAAWWKAQGVRGSSGLKFIAVSGHVARPGVYEIPMGTTVGELIELAGGVAPGKLMAFAPGGASSAFLPPDKLDTPMDFSALQAAGSMLGSGALIVVAEGTDLLALAANVVRFFRNESCGKCVPCRVGSEKAVALLDGVLAGARRAEELAILADLEETMRLTSICGLGQVALVPIQSVRTNFPAAVGSRGGRGE